MTNKYFTVYIILDNKNSERLRGSQLSRLLQLFEFYPLCTEPVTAEVSSVVGALIHVTQKCLTCSYGWVWRSQP